MEFAPFKPFAPMADFGDDDVTQVLKQITIPGTQDMLAQRVTQSQRQNDSLTLTVKLSEELQKQMPYLQQMLTDKLSAAGIKSVHLNFA